MRGDFGFDALQARVTWAERYLVWATTDEAQGRWVGKTAAARAEEELAPALEWVTEHEDASLSGREGQTNG